MLVLRIGSFDGSHYELRKNDFLFHGKLNVEKFESCTSDS